MSKILAFLGLSFVFFISSCDRSIESRLKEQKANTNRVASDVEKPEEKMIITEKSNQDIESNDAEISSLASNENKTTSENKLNLEKTLPEKTKIVSNKTEEAKIEKDHSVLINEAPRSTIKSLSKQDKIEAQSKGTKNPRIETSLAKAEENKKGQAKRGAPIEVKKQPQTTKVDKQSKIEATTVAMKENNQVVKQNKTDTTIKEDKSAPKNQISKVNKEIPENDGTYEDGKLVSNFSEEELRLGAQKPLSKEEIKYFKLQCRYALMSEQDIIENGCQSKKVAISR
ncbi:hypothetical protein [Actinobacillus minor]|uniref:hypothetical protein n=1 Tax=Actinobacillus minor TaxID=51047 RepID=UPI0026EEFDAC|nr:hypothetical protein [Actinobacillus minor]